jgi:hypothetical protein
MVVPLLNSLLAVSGEFDSTCETSLCARLIVERDLEILGGQGRLYYSPFPAICNGGV